MTKADHPVFSPTLLNTREEAAGVRTFRFAAPPNFSFVPGQFVMFHFQDDPKTWRAYSICSSPMKAAEHFEVTVGMVGAFSDRLGALTPGGEHGLVARGPFGKWIYDGSLNHAVLISGGTGITPFRAMCALKRDGGKAGLLTVCYSAKTPDDLIFRGEYAAWKEAGIVVHPRITRPQDAKAPWNGLTGRWTPLELLKIADDTKAVYYLCGPNKMVQEFREGLQSLGVPPENVRTEKWGDYADLI
ncbi:MAG TPA: FAD-dependent oxidoreductase [Elusimicrobiota bacterium]|nr:FAD-dependent oxidoreductase [Elusimicrobiota bacterium]